MVADMRASVRELIAGEPPTACVVIAELGVNHDGSRAQAIRLVEAAFAAGADAVKLQLFEPEELCSRVHRPRERDLLARLRLTDADIRAVLAAAAARALPVFATPFDGPSLRLLRRLDVPVIKIGSGEVTHTPFLAEVARSGRPIILSSGAATWGDLDRAVATLRAHGAENLSLLHCVSAYPPPDDQTHLRLIPRLAERYADCTIGFSDHSVGTTAAIAAVALGARIVEKHLTLDRAAAGPDHAASADPAEFAALVTAVRRVDALLGGEEKAVQACEGVIGRSVVAARDLPAGHVLTEADFAFKRPGGGVRPYDALRLLGRRVTRAVRQDALIAEGDVA